MGGFRPVRAETFEPRGGGDTTRLGEKERVGDARLPRAARAPHAVDVLLRRVREVVERPRGLFETGV